VSAIAVRNSRDNAFMEAGRFKVTSATSRSISVNRTGSDILASPVLVGPECAPTARRAASGR
jgi:hypothetical protein